MRIALQRSIAILLLTVGAASTIYGSWYHAYVVLEEREEEAEILIPVPGPTEMGFSMPGEPALGMPGNEQDPDGAGNFIKKKIVRKVLAEKSVSEPALCREVSFGGVRLLDSGELQQTYSGRPPSLCPS